MNDRLRRWITSPVAGAVIGVFAGGLTILLVEAAGHRLFGTADPADYSSVTTPMFVSVLVAWIVGSFVAGTVSTTWSKTSSLVPASIVGVILLAGAVSNMFVIPHPVWMMVSAAILMPGAAIYAAWRLAAPAMDG